MYVAKNLLYCSILKKYWQTIRKNRSVGIKCNKKAKIFEISEKSGSFDRREQKENTVTKNEILS